MPELERKTIMVESDIWQKVEDMAKQPGQQRAANHQAGVILKEYFEKVDIKNMQTITFKIGDNVINKLFGSGVVVRLNMSGPVVKFDKHENEMCVPNYDLEKDESNGR